MPVLHRKNLNRFRKVYPGIRKTPVYENPVKVEAGYIDIVNDNSGSYIYSSSFGTVPSVTATVFDSHSNGAVNVNLFIGSVNTVDVEIRTSDNITGRIYLQVVGF